MTNHRYRVTTGRTRLACSASIAALSASLAAPLAVAADEAVNDTRLEVIVTAQKREERLQDVPIPVTVLKADELAQSGQLLLRSYYDTVPGFNLVANYGFTQILSIRGVTTGGASNPTVGITVDDVPYGASFNGGGGNQVPDIDPGDLARIEVLRGPQGALYGANSMGGLVKYVTKAPSFDRLSGGVEGGTSSVHGGSDLGYNLRGSANIPVTDSFAMRLSAFTRKDAGYIDNPTLGLDGVNDIQSNGGRVSTLWQISDAVSLSLNALFQRNNINGVADAFVLPGMGDLQQNYMPGIGGSDRTVQAYSAILKAKFGSAELTSITGYSTNEYTNTFDRSATYGTFATRDFGPGTGGMVGIDKNNPKKLSQEIRVAAPLGQKTDWVAGVFLTKEDTHGRQSLMAANRTTGQIVGLDLYRDTPIETREYAAFANVTYHFTDRFDIQFGGRQSQNREDDDVYTQTGPFVGGGPVIQEPLHSKVNTFTYLVTPRLQVSPELMVYARLASGYRPGGPNFAVADGAPPQYDPDKTYNYELGLKSDLLDGALSLDASLYYIDWKDIQISLRTPLSYTYLTNASRAKSQGVELSVSSRPIAGLNITGWVAYNDAQLTEGFPPGPTYGVSGDRLPNSARVTGHVTLEQQFPLWGKATGFVGGAFTYTGERESLFTGTPVRQSFPSYTKTDLRAGMLYDSWTASLFANNITDERGLIGGGIGYQPTYAYTYIAPRTVGLSLSKSF